MQDFIFEVLYFLKLAQFLLALFTILVGLTMTLFSEKTYLTPNLIKKSWTVSNIYVMPHKLTFHIGVCKTDFGHLPNKFFTEARQTTVAVDFSLFSSEVC